MTLYLLCGTWKTPWLWYGSSTLWWKTSVVTTCATLRPRNYGTVWLKCILIWVTSHKCSSWILSWVKYDKEATQLHNIFTIWKGCGKNLSCLIRMSRSPQMTKNIIGKLLKMVAFRNSLLASMLSLMRLETGYLGKVLFQILMMFFLKFAERKVAGMLWLERRQLTQLKVPH